jgi:hypothetical protein
MPNRRIGVVFFSHNAAMANRSIVPAEHCRALRGRRMAQRLGDIVGGSPAGSRYASSNAAFTTMCDVKQSMSLFSSAVGHAK